MTFKHFKLKRIVTAGITSTVVVGCYTRSTLSPNTKQHVMIHMDLNKTMIMSDAVQDLGFKKSLNTILADTSCWGKVAQCTASNTPNAINNKIWEPVMIETNNQNIPETLITYGDFVRNNFQYTHSVDPQIKHKRKHLRQQFTDKGHPGEQYSYIVDKLYDQLHNTLIIPAFLNMIDYLYSTYANNEKHSFSILFRTFGTDLPHVMKAFNKYCKSKGYNDICVDLNDSWNHGVMVHHKNEIYLVIGTFEMDPQFERITENMTLESLNKADRLSFYKHNNSVKCIIKGYKDIYEYVNKQSVLKRKTMAIRDNYCYWGLNGEQSEFGKVMIMDCNDESIHQIFFDDCACYLLDIRDINDTETHVPFEEIDGVHAVHCNSYEIMMNDNYFIDYLRTARIQRQNKQ